MKLLRLGGGGADPELFSLRRTTKTSETTSQDLISATHHPKTPNLKAQDLTNINSYLAVSRALQLLITGVAAYIIGKTT